MMSDGEQALDVGIVGRGRLGRALAHALAASGANVRGPWGRGARAEEVPDSGAVLLCVPDAEIASAAAVVRPGPMLGHCSGATTLEALGGREGFSLHPLLAVSGDAISEFEGAWCAVTGSSEAAVSYARTLAARLGMRVVEVADDDRALYHAAASLAANHLTGVLDAAERMMQRAGVPRDALVPLAGGAVGSWARMGGEAALTGPLRRGDEETVRKQRDAVAARMPELLPLWDSLTSQTRALAERAGARTA